MNPLYNMLNPNTSSIVNRFNAFKQQFSGDPRAAVQRMLDSGQVSQSQYDRAVKIANSLSQFLK